ncbi:FAD-dependent monooxygenase [Staphylococcus arlettae]|uniref:FAD-dependent monooxygenase n=1 Tax=Staphylococcus TaxID=1279 RepID=UPI001950C696|nr:FAD-dependent monooxygenase [Staphylococcus arlettae]MCD8889875.1 FAD-dependent monooxygenase [Staphylococcus arlettae]MDT4051810.1 FAD-dependent monooxygenase [Staphylococcus arlettae]
MKIAVVGAGIGGLTVAALLQEHGHEVKVFEKNQELSEVGAGIGIGGNVIDKLHNHDLAKGIKNAGQIIDTLAIADNSGTALSKIKLKRNTVNLTLERQSLLETIQSYVQPSSIYTGYQVLSIENEVNKVTVHFENHEAETFDLCIGADGLHSSVRASVAPNTKVNYQGYTVFRGLVNDVQLKDTNTATEYWSKQGRVGIVPLLNNKVYWFIAINAKIHNTEYQTYGKPHLQARFNHFPNEVREVLDKQSETGILLHNIYDLKPLKTFVYNRTVLLGDAAHATTPNLGQGAGQAMEDAIVLANCLETYDFDQALERYDKLRVKHTKKIIKKSRKIGKVAQSTQRLFIKVRNAIAKRIPNSLLARQTKFIYKTKDK